jgi:hypothetical protein
MIGASGTKLRGAGNRRDPRFLRQQPPERDLGRSGLLLGRNLTSRSTRTWFALRACGEKRGIVLRKSELSKAVLSSIWPVRKPLPNGLKETRPIPSSSSLLK